MNIFRSCEAYRVEFGFSDSRFRKMGLKLILILLIVKSFGLKVHIRLSFLE